MKAADRRSQGEVSCAWRPCQVARSSPRCACRPAAPRAWSLRQPSGGGLDATQGQWIPVLVDQIAHDRHRRGAFPRLRGQGIEPDHLADRRRPPRTPSRGGWPGRRPGRRRPLANSTGRAVTGHHDDANGALCGGAASMTAESGMRCTAATLTCAGKTGKIVRFAPPPVSPKAPYRAACVARMAQRCCVTGHPGCPAVGALARPSPRCLRAGHPRPSRNHT